MIDFRVIVMLDVQFQLMNEIPFEFDTKRASEMKSRQPSTIHHFVLGRRKK